MLPKQSENGNCRWSPSEVVDNALSSLVAQGLRQAGHDAVHVRDYQMQAASDEEIFNLGASEQCVLVSTDTNFGTLLATYRARTP